MTAQRYKFVELSVVTEESLEECVNRWVGDGWELDAIRFVTGEHSRRPQMAFVSFVSRGEPEAPSTRPRPRRGGGTPWEGVEPSRVHTVIELGELDLGEAPPLDADVDWASARPRRGVAPPDAKRRPRVKRKT